MEAMMRQYWFFCALMITLLALNSCTGSSDNPVGANLPDNSNQNSLSDGSSGALLWGVYDVTIDLESGTAESVPIRSAEFTMNVTKFVDGPPSNLGLNIQSITPGDGYVDVMLDVSITHPFPNFKAGVGFDVMGVFLSNGTAMYPGNDALMIAGMDDPMLLNSDGYTRWFNAGEFGGDAESTTFGYTPGTMANGMFIPSANLNPYRYFADGLGPADDAFMWLESNPMMRGSFMPGSTNTRTYELRFPAGTLMSFQYAIVADWKSAGNPDPMLGDFPPEANSQEARVLGYEDTSFAYYVDGDFGGMVVLDVSPWDWSATVNGNDVDEYEIYMYSDAFGDVVPVDISPIGGTENFLTCHVEIPVETLTSNDPIRVWVEIRYMNDDYSNNFGIDNTASGSLAGVFSIDVPVLDFVPDPMVMVTSPNGGELWGAGSDQMITWDSEYLAGNVVIEYSTDNFVSDVNLITDSAPNNGSYEWEDIVVPYTDMLKVRVSSAANMSISDMSDAEFSIQEGGWGRLYGDISNDHGMAVATDTDGNVYTQGSLTSELGTEFVTKHSKDGELIWEILWSGTGNGSTSTGMGLVIDDNGDVIVCGDWNGIVDFDPSEGENILTCEGWPDSGKDVFLSKFTSDGDYLWTRTWGGDDVSPSDTGMNLCVDDNSNIIVTGYCGGNVDLMPGPGEDWRDGFGSYDSFIIKFDPDGNRQWAWNWGGPGMDMGMATVADSAGNIFVCHDYEGMVDLNPDVGVDEFTAVGATDVALTKYDPDGNYLWSVSFGGEMMLMSTAITMDSMENIIITGDFGGEVDFDPGPGEDIQTSPMEMSVFCNKLDKDGNHLWANVWGGMMAGMQVAVDSMDGIYVPGDFMDMVDFDPGPGVDDRMSYEMTGDFFITKFDADGNYEWTNTFGGPMNEIGYGVAIDPNDRIYVTGMASGPLDLAPDSGLCEMESDIENTLGDADAAIIKYMPDGCW